MLEGQTLEGSAVRGGLMRLRSGQGTMGSVIIHHESDHRTKRDSTDLTGFPRI